MLAGSTRSGDGEDADPARWGRRDGAWGAIPSAPSPTRERLLGAQRLQSVGLLAAALAHDIDALLGTILGNSMLAREATQSGDVARHLERVAQAAWAARVVARMTLDFAQDLDFASTRLDLSAQVRRFTPLLEIALEPEHELRLALAEDLPQALASLAGVQQILLNLVANASQALGARRGVITIVTGAARPGGASLHGTLAIERETPWPARCVFLRVADTGPGMDEKTASRIFEPFFTTRDERTGLGLAAVREIVRSCGGAVRVETRRGAGTAFTLFFPAV